MKKPSKFNELSKRSFDKINDLDLNDVEKKVVTAWIEGKPKYEAWVNVVKPDLKVTKDNRASVMVQSNRFWKRSRVQNAIASLQREGVIAIEIKESKTQAKPKPHISDDQQQQAVEAITNFSQKVCNIATKELTPDKRRKTKPTEEEIVSRTYDKQREAWLESFKDIENPTATTPYGIGLWLAIEVITNVNRKKALIAKKKLDPFEFSPYSSTDVSAIKAVLSALLPFAPAPTPDETKSMTMASVIVSMTAEEAGINPDAYTAPLPAGVEVHGAIESCDVKPETVET